MAINLEKIKPWDGQSGTGADNRGIIDRNFEALNEEDDKRVKIPVTGNATGDIMVANSDTPGDFVAMSVEDAGIAKQEDLVQLAGDKLDKTSIKTIIGASDTDVMSQKAVTMLPLVLNWIEGQYFNSDGSIVNNVSYRRTDYISVYPERTYIINNQHRVCFYDKNKILISVISNITQLVIPDNCYYIMFSTLISPDAIVLYDSTDLLFNFSKKSETEDYINQLTKLMPVLKWNNGYYLDSNNNLIAGAQYSYTDYFAVEGGVVYKTNNGHRIIFVDINYNFISFAYNVNTVTSPENAVYCRISSLFNNVFFYNDNDYYYRVVKKEEFIPALNKLDYIESSNSNLVKSSLDSQISLDKIHAKLVSGTIGAEGAIYEIPVRSKGEYRMAFEFKMPKNINTGETENILTLAKLPVFPTSALQTEGGFYLKLRQLQPETGTMFAQPIYKSGIIFQPVTIWNNIRADYTPPKEHKPFVGDDIFSVRYIGDVTQAINQDVCINITDSGLLIYHSSDNSVIIEEPFPENQSLHDFIAGMITKTSDGGVYSGLIEFDFYGDVESKTTDDIVRFSGVKMVANYDSQYVGKGWNAFPTFVSLYDDTWHKVEIVYNSNGSIGLDVIAMALDGFVLPYIDKSVTNLGGTFNDTLTLGCSGVTIRNYSFENYVSDFSGTRIEMYMLHDIVDGLYDQSNSPKTSVGRIYEIIKKNKAAGNVYVTFEQISDYLNGSIELPPRCYSIIHDDYHYLADTTSELVNKVRNLYISNGVKPSFAIITTDTKNVDKTIFTEDDSAFNFHPHAYVHQYLINLSYNELIAEINNMISGFRNLYKAPKYMTYAYGKYDLNIMKILDKILNIAFLVDSVYSSSCISRRSNRIALARRDGSDYAPLYILGDR